MTTASRPPRPAGFSLIEIMLVVVLIGLLSVMAIPQFMKIRMRSQDTAVLGNARQLASASAQYFTTSGASSAAITQLVGPTNYVKSLATVACESYPATYCMDVVITISGVAGARTITYVP